MLKLAHTKNVEIHKRRAISAKMNDDTVHIYVFTFAHSIPITTA